MTEHTPGPWGVTHNGEGYPMIHGPEATDPATEARHHFIATLMPHPANLYMNGRHRTTDGIAEREANARLIASAPFLKAQLIEAVECLEYIIARNPDNWSAETARNRAKQIIASVKGKEYVDEMEPPKN